MERSSLVQAQVRQLDLWSCICASENDDSSFNVTNDAGIGLSAKFIEQGGADLILVYNSGRYRMAGRGSLAGMMPYGDANAIVVDMVSTQSLQVSDIANFSNSIPV